MHCSSCKAEVPSGLERCPLCGAEDYERPREAPRGLPGEPAAGPTVPPRRAAGATPTRQPRVRAGAARGAPAPPVADPFAELEKEAPAVEPAEEGHCVDVLEVGRGARLKDAASFLAYTTHTETPGVWRKRLRTPPFRVYVDWSPAQCERLVKGLRRYGVRAEVRTLDSPAPTPARQRSSAMTIVLLVVLYTLFALIVARYRPEWLPEEVRRRLPWAAESAAPAIEVPARLAEGEIPALAPEPTAVPGPGTGWMPRSAPQTEDATPAPRATLSPQELYRSAVRALRAGDAPRAAQIARELLTRDPSNAQYQELLSDAVDRQALRDYAAARGVKAAEEAIPGLQALAERHPEWVEGRRLLALIYLEAGRFADAEQALAEFDTPGLDDPELLEALSEIWRRKGDAERAEQYHRRALRSRRARVR